MKTQAQHARGFTLVEMAVVLVVLGILFGMCIPSFQSYRRTHLLQTGAENLLGQLRLARQKALGIQHDQRLTFSTASNNFTVQDLVTSQTFGPFSFPKEIVLDQVNLVEGGVTGASISATSDGRFSGSGELVLKDPKGVRDTVSVEVSGMTLTR